MDLKTDREPKTRLRQYIEVLWELDKDRLEWWEAEEISETDVVFGLVLVVVIVIYSKRGTYDANEAEVEFLRVSLVTPLRRCEQKRPNPKKLLAKTYIPRLWNERGRLG